MARTCGSDSRGPPWKPRSWRPFCYHGRPFSPGYFGGALCSNGVCSGLRRYRMRRSARSFALIAWLLLTLSGPTWPAEPVCPPSAVVPTQDQLQDAVRNARDHGALWRLEKGGRHGYLYGTIHIANLEWAMPGPTISRALRESETIAIEADPSDPATGAG